MEFSTLLLGAIIGALVGVLATWLALRNSSQSELQKKYDSLKLSHETYQVQVSNHFQQTSELIESLNDRYQAVNLHIAKGIDELAKPDALIDQTRSYEGRLTSNIESDETPEETPSAPRDYAEKDTNKD